MKPMNATESVIVFMCLCYDFFTIMFPSCTRVTVIGVCSSMNPSIERTSTKFPLISACPMSVSRVVVIPSSPTLIDAADELSIDSEMDFFKAILSNALERMTMIIALMQMIVEQSSVMRPPVVPKW